MFSKVSRVFKKSLKIFSKGNSGPSNGAGPTPDTSAVDESSTEAATPPAAPADIPAVVPAAASAATRPEDVVLPQAFRVKYLGKRFARGLWGIKHTREPVDELVTAAR